MLRTNRVLTLAILGVALAAFNERVESAEPVRLRAQPPGKSAKKLAQPASADPLAAETAALPEYNGEVANEISQPAPASPKLADRMRTAKSMPSKTRTAVIAASAHEPEEIFANHHDTPCNSGCLLEPTPGDCRTECCDDCCQECCEAIWKHRCGVWGEFLYLRPTGVDMAHAIQQNGTGGAGTVPNGRVGTAAPDYEPAYRAGARWAFNDCASIWVSYTFFESHTVDALDALGGVGSTVASLVLHPGTDNAGSTTSHVDASYDIDFQLADVQYSHILTAGPRHVINYNVGARYASLDQNFKQNGVFAPPTGDLRTTSEVNFDGGGPRFGLDGRAQVGDCGFSVYGNTFLSLLFGEFRSAYQQYNFTTDTVEALSYWDDQRMVSLLETELGLSWTSCGGCLRLSAGYYVGWWFNSVTIPKHIQAVQNANFVGVSDTITFDGLVARAELRF